MDQAVDMLVSAWGTQRQPIPKEMEAPFLRLVEIPEMSTYPVTDKQVTCLLITTNVNSVFYNIGITNDWQ